jgi:hypothetical protein
MFCVIDIILSCSVAKDMGDPSEDHPGLFGWVRPVLSVSDSMMVRTVGLDAVVVSAAILRAVWVPYRAD